MRSTEDAEKKEGGEGGTEWWGSSLPVINWGGFFSVEAEEEEDNRV